MGLRGPPPTPTAILNLRGSWRGKQRMGEVQFESGAPTCPAWLSKEAKAEWRRAVRLLASVGLLQKVDRALLACYCDCWAEVMTLTTEINRRDGPADAWRLIRMKAAAVER